MKKLIFLFSLFIAFQAVAQEGIRFRHCSWEEAKAMAKKEKKPIFIDFYTQWCGPCLNMAENIFTLGSVGNFYNDHFVCLSQKIRSSFLPHLCFCKSQNRKSNPYLR